MNNENRISDHTSLLHTSRRDFIRKASYAAPILLTLPAAPSLAQQGSGRGMGDPGGGGGDPGGGGGDPGGDFDCNGVPTGTGGGAGQVQMCHFTFDEQTNMFGFEDIFVDESAVQDNLARGDLFGSCESIFCAGS